MSGFTANPANNAGSRSPFEDLSVQFAREIYLALGPVLEPEPDPIVSKISSFDDVLQTYSNGEMRFNCF